MRSQSFAIVMALLCLLVAPKGQGQTSQYQRPGKNTVNKEDKAAGPTAPDSGKEEYKVDISDIEKKYWAPKDTDFSVVQSRTYTKEKRYSLSLQTGPVINDTFNRGFNYGATLNYFLSERNGVEFTYVSSDWNDSKATENFIREVGGTGGVAPDYNRVESYYGIAYNWVPAYAKMSLLSSKIIYFDMALSPGLGVTNYQKITESGNVSDSAMTFTLDITQYYFLSKHIAIRADLKNRWFKEERVRYRTGADIGSQTSNTTLFLLGITYYH